MFIKTSLAVALSLAVQLPSVWAEEAKPAESPKTEAAKPAEPAKPAEKPADAKDAKTEAPKGDTTEAQKVMDEAHRQNRLMEKFQLMLQEGVKAENPALKAAAEKLSKIMDNPTPPTLDSLNAALTEFKAAKGTLSPEDTTFIEDISNLLRDILKQVSSRAENQEKAAPATDSMDSDEDEDEDEDDAKDVAPKKK